MTISVSFIKAEIPMCRRHKSEWTDCTSGTFPHEANAFPIMEGRTDVIEKSANVIENRANVI